jgi:G3E family GTPase
LIESTGISKPLLVAETFTFADENGTSLSDVASLDTMVTVVDALNFLTDYDEAKYLKETGEHLGEEDERSVADLLVDQVEFADVILISKTDLVKEAHLQRLIAVLKSLNTEARIIPIRHGQVDIEQVLGTGRFSFERAKQARAGSRKCAANTCRKPKSHAPGAGFHRPEARPGPGCPRTGRLPAERR